MGFQRILVEATVVGILVVVIGAIVGFGIGALFSSNLPKICKEWNKNHVMEISLFLTGFLVHLICEAIGINKWYCSSGNACLKI